MAQVIYSDMSKINNNVNATDPWWSAPQYNQSKGYSLSKVITSNSNTFKVAIYDKKTGWPIYITPGQTMAYFKTAMMLQKANSNTTIGIA